MKHIVYGLVPCLVLILSGCGPITSKQALKQDNVELEAKQILTAVSGNSLILTAYDFSGTVYFKPDGNLSAIDNQDQRDVGKWDVNDQNRLCLKFRLWYYGDVKCYSVFNNPQADKLTFFTDNGAAYYTAMSVAGEPAALAGQLDAQAAPKSVRNQNGSQKDSQAVSSDEQTRSSKQTAAVTIDKSETDDSGLTVKRLAGNCPGCNMAGIDLKEASLIKANLRGANLQEADLRYANLRRADLSGANLSGALLNFANLPGADLSNADLSGADLSGANLLLTNFTGADITGALFTSANLEKTIGLPDTP
jgi:hypothetical protein